MGIILQDHAFTSRYSRTKLDKLPASVKASVNGTSVEQLRMADAMASNLTLSRSTIEHPKAVRGVFSSKELGKDELIAPIYGALVQEIPNATIAVNQIHGEGIYALTNGEFDKFFIDTDAKINLNERTGIRNIFINAL